MNCREESSTKPGAACSTQAGRTATSTEERWLPVVDYQGRYEVSDRGRIRSFVRRREGKLLACARSHGYPAVVLSGDDGCAAKLVHRLVAEAFIGPAPGGHDVDHIDGNRGNPRAENLEYVSRSENLRRAALLRSGRLVAHGDRAIVFAATPMVPKGGPRRRAWLKAVAARAHVATLPLEVDL